MSYGLNPLKGDYVGEYTEIYWKVIPGDTRNLDSLKGGYIGNY